MKIKPSKSRIAFQIFNYTLMLLATFVCVYPFWYIVIYTFSDAAKAGIKNPVFLPRGVLRTVVGTVAAVLVCSFLGYMFTKEEMPGRKFMYRFLVMTMYINGGLISTFIVMKSYGLLNTFWIYILPMMISAYNIVLIKTYMESLPASLEESAMLDGAGYIKVFTSIILPLSKPIIATVAVFVAVGHWNSWFDNHIYTRGESSLTTLQYLLYNYLNESQRLAEQIKNTSNLSSIENAMGTISPKGVRMTITVLASLPIFMVYPFMQKYFVKGIMIGAVKG